MTAILVLSLLACAAWIAVDLGRRRRRDLRQSVEGFSRGLRALDPAGAARRQR